VAGRPLARIHRGYRVRATVRFALDVVHGGVLGRRRSDVFERDGLFVEFVQIVSLRGITFHNSLFTHVPRPGISQGMFRFLAFLLLCTTAGTAWAAAQGPQKLTVDIRGSAPRIDALERYIVNEPVTVHVDAPFTRSASLVGVAPDGGNVRIPLQRGADGSFVGMLTFPASGIWSLAVDAGSEARTSTFSISAGERDSHAGAALMLALSFASIAGGFGLITIARKVSPRRADPAA
jgi:hypothetical protein